MKGGVKQPISLREYQVKRAFAVSKNEISIRLDKDAFRTKTKKIHKFGNRFKATVTKMDFEQLSTITKH